MLKKALLVAAFALLPIGAMAQERNSAPTDRGAELVNSVLGELGVRNPAPETQARFHRVLQFAFGTGWRYAFLGSGDMGSAKFKDDPVRTLEIIIPSDERTAIVSCTYYPAAKQMMISIKEILAGDATTILNHFKESKADKSYSLIAETDHMGFLRKTSNAQMNVYRIVGAAGSVTYVHFGMIDVVETPAGP